MSRIKPELKVLQEFYMLQGKKVCNTCGDVLELTATNFTPRQERDWWFYVPLSTVYQRSSP